MSSEIIDNQHFETYQKFLKEKSRPPSKGGNTKALHSHLIIINGEKYSFLSLGSQQWAFKSDKISFEYELKDGYKNIITETFVTISSSGEPVIRGNRGSKKYFRTADTRSPASRREQRG
jgi:hypothetical protein